MSSCFIVKIDWREVSVFQSKLLGQRNFELFQVLTEQVDW